MPIAHPRPALSPAEQLAIAVPIAHATAERRGFRTFSALATFPSQPGIGEINEAGENACPEGWEYTNVRYQGVGLHQFFYRRLP